MDKARRDEVEQQPAYSNQVNGQVAKLSVDSGDVLLFGALGLAALLILKGNPFASKG